MNADPPQGQLNEIINLHHSDQMSQVINICKKLLITYKKSLVLFNILGSALQATEKFIEAVDCYNQAIEYANNIDSIKSIRTELRHNMQNSDLCNANVFTRNIEQAYQNMYSKLHIDH